MLHNCFYHSVELSRERGDYDYDYDSDADDYDYKWEEYKKTVLTPQIKPIIIYNNRTFAKYDFQLKYKSIIEDEIIDHKLEWNDVKKVIKVERRYER